MNIIKRTIIKIMGKRSRPMMEHTFGMIGDLSRAFYEKDGKEALPVITEVASKAGVERAEIMQNMTSIRNMKDIGEAFKMMDIIMDMGLETVELSNDTFHFKLKKCPLGIEGTSRDLCEAMMATETKMLNILLGQEVETKILKTLAVGDRECEIMFSKR